MPPKKENKFITSIKYPYQDSWDKTKTHVLSQSSLNSILCREETLNYELHWFIFFVGSKRLGTLDFDWLVQKY